MASLLQQHPLLLSLSQSYAPPFLPRTVWRIRKPMSPHLHRGGGVVARLGPVGFSEFHAAGELTKELFERVEGYVYTLADAAVTSATSPELAGAVVEEGQKQGRDWLSGITDYMESVLKVLKNGLSALHVPYSYGFAIILLTILVKTATFPLTKKQVESAMAMRSLQPQVKAIQERYAGNQEKIQLETARLYKVAGVNPLAGCLPTLATIPVWIGLYRALSNVANEGLLTEGFFWIPSLAGPTTIAARQSGSGVSWIFPFVDGHPPLGWPDTLAYLVLPILLVVSQYISTQIMQPAAQGNDPSQKNAQAITKFLPLMIGYFSLSVPSGLSLYWFTNNILSTAQQIWLQKLGGAKNPFKENNAGSKETISSILTGTEETLSGIKTDPKSDVIKEISSQPKSESGGPQPGERFRQIKEQEARRKREREEEQRKAEEDAKASQSNVGDPHPPNLNLIESNMQTEESSVVEKSKSTILTDDSSKIDSTNINGSHANQDPNEGETNLQFSSDDGIAHNSDTEVDNSHENAL